MKLNPLAPEEYAQLEANIEGCRDPLVVWDGTLIDGHNRFEICSKLGLPFKTEHLMGYRDGWASLSVTEMQSLRKLRRS